MSNAKPTIGPWTFNPPWSGFSSIHGANGELVFGIAAGTPDEKQPDDVCEANARLIAAAPDMLEALKTVQAWLLSTKPMPEASKEIWNSVFVDANNVVAAAIAKATQR